jgi:hypothetical protein
VECRGYILRSLGVNGTAANQTSRRSSSHSSAAPTSQSLPAHDTFNTDNIIIVMDLEDGGDSPWGGQSIPISDTAIQGKKLTEQMFHRAQPTQRPQRPQGLEGRQVQPSFLIQWTI